MNRDNLGELYKKYELTTDDVFKHKHYLIITRSGIEKIMAKAGIEVSYEVVRCEKDFAAVKAIGTKENSKLETFGSCVFGEKEWIKFDEPNQYGKTGKWKENGNTSSWYILEIAEKRAMSRVVLKMTDFYKFGAMGEDESEEFKKEK